MLKTFDQFIQENVNEALDPNASSFLHHRFSNYDANAWKKECNLPLQFTATEEQIEWAKKRAASFPEWQRKNLPEKVLQNSLNGLIAETVLADALGIERDPNDIIEHASDGGVDVVINGIPCDVKCTTIKDGYNGKPLLKNGWEIKVIKNGSHVHGLKNSLYIIGTLYHEPSKTVYVVGAMTTGSFMWNGKSSVYGNSKTFYQQVGNFKHPSTLDDLKRQIVWKDTFKKYGYEWDAENNEVIPPNGKVEKEQQTEKQ